jgi:hypothetical protein
LPPYSKYPEIYYEPKKIIDVSGKTLVDITSTSGQGMYEPEQIRKYVNEFCPQETSVVACFQSGIAIPMLLVDGYPMVFVNSIFHYCDLIASCKKFVVLHSGGMVMASALQEYGHIDCDCLISSHPIHTVGQLRKHHFYDNINYISI